jgi:cyclopropane fatty-acyl-phospholipid synthase-like methyltransferase
VIRAVVDKVMECPLVYNVYQQAVRRGAVVEKTLAEEVHLGPGSRVLDLACGAGLYAHMFPRDRYLGVDLSHRYVGFARRSNRDHRFSVMDARRLALRSGSVDRIFAVGLFHHLSNEDAVGTLRDARRVLKPDGEVVIVDLIPPVSRRDVVGRILVRLDRGRHVRTHEAYRGLFSQAFTSARDYRIRTGPYDLCVFVLKPSLG